jgi:hypothetical protein
MAMLNEMFRFLLQATVQVVIYAATRIKSDIVYTVCMSYVNVYHTIHAMAGLYKSQAP